MSLFRKLPAVWLTTVAGVALVPSVALGQGEAPSPAAAGSAGTPQANPPVDSLSIARMPAREPDHPGRALKLDEALRLALQQQPQILAARAQTGVADAEVEETRAPLLPQVTANAQYTYGTLHSTPGVATVTSTGAAGSTGTMGTTGGNTGTNGNTGTGGASTTNGTSIGGSPAGYLTFGATATQLIYDFGQTTGRFGAAKKTLESQRSNEQTTRVQVLLNVRRAYFTARANRELVDVAHETLEDQQTHLQQVQGFVTVGTQPQIALVQEKAAVANAEVQLITAQNNYDTARAQLNQAAGIPGGTDYDVVDDTSPPVDDEEQPLETLVHRALEGRPEIATLIKQREAQSDLVGAARGGYGPTLEALASVDEGGIVNPPSSSTGLNFFWSVGLSATWPIFQGGLTQGQVRQAEATLDNLNAQQNLEALQVRLDVNSAQLAVRAAKATIGASQDAVTNAYEQLRLAEQRYATGVGSIIELNDAQVAYTTAAAQLVQARYQLASARAQFLAAMGRT